MEAARLPDGRVAITFTHDESLVLSDALSRWETAGAIEALPFADKAEKIVIFDLIASFEPMIEEAFSDQYGSVVARARAAVRGLEAAE
jgi:hypothetical protein